jgi:hypothetical protein
MSPPAASASQEPLSVPSRVRAILKSTRNKFGLFRQYRAAHFPEHDPDENLTSDILMNGSSANTSSNLPVDTYYPYPNQSSFLLGEWYWNDGAKKSQSGFKNLLKIIGHPDFQPQDVARVKWQRIDAQLGGDLLGDVSDGEESENGWEDERPETDWVETPIKIKVPFHSRTRHPGQEEFEAGKLRHRKLIPVIREKISRSSSFAHFHLEPYELHWQPNGADSVRVHGEFYSSEAFIDAHHSLQDSPGEPGCELQRVVVGLMFASDGTELTAFSDAHLWPVYLAVGNESKYRRSKPSCKAWEHIAYFERVSTAFWLCTTGKLNLIYIY